ncbi:MAG TPA: DUF3110 domain-containing protein [Leptolyngbyaceae cyanobacterium]
MRVFVLLFNARTENEGIHTLKIGDRDKVLMFESEDDATRFCVQLEAQDFLSPSVEAIDDEEIKEFCQSADYDWELIPEGALALPPETNLDRTDWQPDREMADRTESEMSDSELDRLRRRLEGLL